MQSVLQQVESEFKKPQVVDVQSGDTVKVHQKIKEGNKERIQVFEGLVIRTAKKGSLSSTFTVRRIASGIGVEKTYLSHSPLIVKVEVTKRSKVKRNYLSYMRARKGKSARLSGIDFDRQAVNDIHDAASEAEEAKLHEQLAKEAEEKLQQKAALDAETDAKVKQALESRSEEQVSQKDN
jgi:large subunit ribosomal protein L19